MHVQRLLGCTALNVKRLATRGEAARGQAAGPHSAQADGQEAADDAISADQTARNAAANVSTRPPIVPATGATWTIILSMN